MEWSSRRPRVWRSAPCEWRGSGAWSARTAMRTWRGTGTTRWTEIRKPAPGPYLEGNHGTTSGGDDMNAENAAVTYDLKQAKEDAVKLLLHPNSNVAGIGIGKKVKGGLETQEDCVRVYVVSRIGPNDLSPKSLVPPDVHGVPTDVIEVGRFGRRGRRPQPRADTTPRPGSPIRVRTNAPNVNEGHRGTLGAVVTDGTNRYILGCNHTLAVNGRVPKDAAIVSAEFVGAEETLAEPGCFIALERDSGNSVDCAVAVMPAPTKVQPTFPDGLALSAGDPAEPLLDMKVTK